MAQPHVRPLAAGDRAAWEPLWAGYLDFYATELPAATTAATFERLTGDEPAMAGLVAEADGRVVGFLHYVLHPTTWTTGPACYLEDLYVAPEQRGTGAGRALISALVAHARRGGWSGIHWMTAADNATAMHLYDRLATKTSWVRYEIDLDD
jgi:GNAT superfamily N-acetyltransferase